MTIRCAACRRRVNPDHYTQITRDDGSREMYCADRAECRRATHGVSSPDLAHEPDSRTLGAALITADYVAWPWWCRLVPRGQRDELAERFASLFARAEAGRTRPHP